MQRFFLTVTLSFMVFSGVMAGEGREETLRKKAEDYLIEKQNDQEVKQTLEVAFNYWEGADGFQQDKEIAISLVRTLAETGNSKAMTTLSFMLAERDVKEAIRWYELATSMGKTDKQGSSGLMIRFADNLVESDLNEALKWYIRSYGERAIEVREKMSALLLEEAGEFHKKMHGKWYLSPDGCKSSLYSFLVLHNDVVMKETASVEQIEYSTILLPGRILSFGETYVIDYYADNPLFEEKMEGYIATDIKRCPDLNKEANYILFESDALEFDSFLAGAQTKCPGNLLECVDHIWDYVDVSEDDGLTKAELTRMMRHMMKFFSVTNEKTDEGDPYIITGTTMVAAPMLAGIILNNYDYNDDGKLTRQEMTHDLANLLGTPFERGAARSLMQMRENLPDLEADKLQGLIRNLLY